MPFACHSHTICMSLVCTSMSSVCHSYILVCHPYGIRMSLICHLYVTHMYSYAILMSLVCTRMSPIFHSYVVLPWIIWYYISKDYTMQMFMKVTANSIKHNAKSAERQKTSFPKESVENADLHKLVLNKILTTYK